MRQCLVCSTQVGILRVLGKLNFSTDTEHWVNTSVHIYEKNVLRNLHILNNWILTKTLRWILLLSLFTGGENELERWSSLFRAIKLVRLIELGFQLSGLMPSVISGSFDYSLSPLVQDFVVFNFESFKIDFYFTYLILHFIFPLDIYLFRFFCSAKSRNISCSWF